MFHLDNQKRTQKLLWKQQLYVSCIQWSFDFIVALTLFGKCKILETGLIFVMIVIIIKIRGLHYQLDKIVSNFVQLILATTNLTVFGKTKELSST